MKVTIICSDERHPIKRYISEWVQFNGDKHEISIRQKLSEIVGGDLLFLISCSEIVREEHRALFTHCFVVHASALPQRRGWSPHIWAILDGESEITVSLLEADDPVDSGLIYAQRTFSTSADMLLHEINAKLFAAEFELMDWALAAFGNYHPRPQKGRPTFCRKRAPADSEIRPYLSIAEQFDVLRLADPVRFPAFFNLHGYTYHITLTKKECANDADT